MIACMTVVLSTAIILVSCQEQTASQPRALDSRARTTTTVVGVYRCFDR
jgi:hypothetical protein